MITYHQNINLMGILMLFKVTIPITKLKLDEEIQFDQTYEAKVGLDGKKYKTI